MCKYDHMYMNIAYVLSDNSEALRAKVGCVIVKDRKIISEGFNGTPAGYKTNYCEDIFTGNTMWYTIHAEMNALMKAAREGHAVQGATLYTTLSPCKDCSKHIRAAGITEVVYGSDYRDTDGLDSLRELGVGVRKI